MSSAPEQKDPEQNTTKRKFSWPRSWRARRTMIFSLGGTIVAAVGGLVWRGVLNTAVTETTKRAIFAPVASVAATADAAKPSTRDLTKSAQRRITENLFKVRAETSTKNPDGLPDMRIEVGSSVRVPLAPGVPTPEPEPWTLALEIFAALDEAALREIAEVPVERSSCSSPSSIGAPHVQWQRSWRWDVRPLGFTEEMPAYEHYIGPTRGVVIVTTSDDNSKKVGGKIAEALGDEGVVTEVVLGLDEVNERRAQLETVKGKPPVLANRSAISVLIDVGERPDAPTQMIVQSLAPANRFPPATVPTAPTPRPAASPKGP